MKLEYYVPVKGTGQKIHKQKLDEPRTGHCSAEKCST